MKSQNEHNPTIRLLMLQSNLETLKSRGTGEIYQQKLAVLPLQQPKKIELEPPESLQNQKKLTFIPAVAQLVGSIENKGVVGAISAVLLTVFALTNMVLYKTTQIPSAQAQSSRSSSSIVSAKAAQIDTLTEQSSSAAGYGEELFSPLKAPLQASLQIEGKEFILKDIGFSLETGSQLPGQKGYCIVKTQQPIVQFGALTPGDRVQILEKSSQGVRAYKYVFVHTVNTQELQHLTETQKSMFIGILETNQGEVGYLFRLVSVQ